MIEFIGPPLILMATIAITWLFVQWVARKENMGNEIRNRMVSEMSAETGENAAKCSEAIRAYYDLRLRYLRENPAAVAAFDAEELARAADREQE